MKNTMKYLGIIALAALIGFSFAACDNGTTGGGGGYTPNNSGRDSRLVCTGNEAWVDDYPVGNRDGFIFKADGSFQIIDDYNGSTVGVWAVYGTGSWTTSGNNTLTISGSGGSRTFSYTVTGNTLRIFDNSSSTTLTKTTITIGGGGTNPGGGGGTSTLTITGLPQGSWGVEVFPAGTDISTSGAIADAGSSRKGEAGATGAYQNNNVFSLNYFGWQPSRGPYKESGRKEVVLARIDDTSWYYATVNFSNGSATVPFSNFTKTLR